MMTNHCGQCAGEKPQGGMICSLCDEKKILLNDKGYLQIKCCEPCKEHEREVYYVHNRDTGGPNACLRCVFDGWWQTANDNLDHRHCGKCGGKKQGGQFVCDGCFDVADRYDMCDPCLIEGRKVFFIGESNIVCANCMHQNWHLNDAKTYRAGNQGRIKRTKEEKAEELRQAYLYRDDIKPYQGEGPRRTALDTAKAEALAMRELTKVDPAAIHVSDGCECSASQCTWKGSWYCVNP